MDHHIGFAFSIEQISFAVFERPDMVLSGLGSTAYPFDYAEERFLQQEARISLTSVLKNILVDKEVNAKSVAFSIESNLATLKRITYPENLEESGVTDHITWHLAESLNQPVNSYTVVRSGNISEREGLKEELVITIKRDLVRFFREIARDLEIPLKSLTVHHLAAEFALNSAFAEKPEKLLLLLKITPSRVESCFFLDGRYYNSHFSRLPAGNTAQEFESNLINQLKQEIGYIENLLMSGDQKLQLPVNRILAYGPALDASLLSTIQKNMSIPVERFNPLNNIAVADALKQSVTAETASHYVECVGVSLDQ